MALNEMDAGPLIACLKLRFRFSRIGRARLWLATRMVHLIGLVGGFNVEVEVAEDDGPGTWAHHEQAAGAR